MLAGFSGGIEAEDDAALVPRPLLFGNFSLCGIMLSYRSDPLVIRRASGVNCLPRSLGDAVHERVVALLDEGAIRPLVGHVAPWSELPEQLERMRQRQTMGRTVIDWRPA